MALSPSRVHQGAETEHPWEREAIDLVLQGLPDVDPYHAWPLHELHDPASGRLYEIDLMVLGRHCLYLIEIKSWPGRLKGDVRDWRRIRPGGGRQTLDNPYFLANRKAKVLAGLLNHELPEGQRIWVEALVFLSHPELEVELAANARSHVVGHTGIIRALTHADYPGADPRGVVNRPLMREVVRAMDQLGLRPSATRRLVGEYQLGPLLAEGNGFQDHMGSHTEARNTTVRIRTYLVARASTAERRAQLERAARREFEVLTQLGDHRSILRCRDLVTSAERGPALLFDHFEEGIPLDQLLRVRPDLPFSHRIEILVEVADAVDFCHRQGVLHRALSPQTILVGKGEKGYEVRLHSFQMARRDDATTSGTLHLSDLGDPAAVVYRAPEVQVDPSKATELSDIWSLGAVAYFVLTGQPPAAGLRELNHRLEQYGALHPGAVRDDLTQQIDELVASATRLHSANRTVDLRDWINQLLEVATAPSDHGTTVDPYLARKGDRLDEGMVVKGELGSGASARVLRVQRDGRDYALKVPHDDGCMQRLRAEAEVLERLHHSSIVRCHGVRKVGGRVCLLLDYAGDESLATRLRQEGTFGLDFARRFGDDLLSALQHLEEHEVQHRDIKPGNIGFTPEEKKARHLLLFDFSLATLPASQISAGTPAYRDPSLPRRGAWDAAADRYGAAACLYEMLTGSRPETIEQEGGGFVAQVEAERFDPAVRDRMATFFRRAFDPDAGQRFASAEAMKTEWLALYAERRADQEPARPRLGAEVGPGDPVELLDLGTRARNALDRAGVLTVRELMALPRNHLSAIRGVGVKVAKEIMAVADQLRQRLGTTTDDGPEQFLPALGGRAEPLAGHHGLSPMDLTVLADAALTTTADLAQAPAARVERLLGEATAAAARQALTTAAAEEQRRTPLERWADEVLACQRPGRPTAAETRVGALLGLEPLPGESQDTGGAPAYRGLSEVAAAFAISRQLLHQGLNQHRERWRAAACCDELLEAVSRIAEEAGGVLRFETAAERLVELHGSGATGPPAEELRRAAALVRIVAELRPVLGEQAPLLVRRINSRTWLGRDAAELDALRSLAGVADRLAAADELGSTGEVRERLQREAAGTPLARRSAADLVRLAAAAAHNAALSARLELYPPGLSAERALRLSQSVLAVPELTAEVLRHRVRERYPEAEPLPERPELDALLEPYGLRFDRGAYRRRGVDLPSVSATARPVTRYASAGADQRRAETPQAREASRFDQALRSGLERGRFRVLSVPADHAVQAAQRLAESYPLEVISIDHALWHSLEQVMQRRNVQREAVIEADRAGPAGPNWGLLCRVVAAAADELVDHILASRQQPQLLVNPGLLARYGLSAALQRLAEQAEHGDGAAILLLVPGHAQEEGAATAINDTLPVPAPIPGQRLLLPTSWLSNAHHAAAEEPGQ